MASSFRSDPFEKVNRGEFMNWIKLNLALLYGKIGIHDFIKKEVENFHMNIKTSIYGNGRPKRCNSCKSEDIIWNGSTWIMQRVCHLDCERWLQELGKLLKNPIDPARVYWNNSYIPEWPSKPWECAKIFLPKGQPRSNTGPDKSDSQALMTLLANCRHFRKKLSKQGLCLTYSISQIRNNVMHSPVLEVSEYDMNKGVQQIINFLQDQIFRSVDECTKAITKIQEILKADYKIVLKDENEAKLFYLEGQLCNIQMQMAEGDEKHRLRFLQLEKEIESLKDLFQTLDSSEEMQKNIKENIDKVLEEVNDTIKEHAKRIARLESGFGQIKEIVDRLIEKDPDIQEEESARLYVQGLTSTTGWDHNSDAATLHLVKSANQGKLVQCRLLLQEGVRMEMKHLPDIICGKVSLKILQLVINHLKDINEWNFEHRYASVALEYAISLQRTDLQSELIREKVKIEAGIDYDEFLP